MWYRSSGQVNRYTYLHEKIFDVMAPYDILSSDDKEVVFGVIRRFIRSRSFLLLYYPLHAPDNKRSLSNALRRKDASGLSLLDRVGSFVEHLAAATAAERQEMLVALKTLQTGTRYLRDGDVGEDREQRLLLANVRLATGGVRREDRRQLLLAFNSPFFPEVLIASSVFAEGVDLQRDCRFVIHHDLDWNPSTLDQRTGRVDRIGAKADRVQNPIHIYLPFLAATQDEKMYRVVRDRERWFQVIMGEKYALDESLIDAIEQRIPLPESAARELAFDLAVYRG